MQGSSSSSSGRGGGGGGGPAGFFSRVQNQIQTALTSQQPGSAGSELPSFTSSSESFIRLPVSSARKLRLYDSPDAEAVATLVREQTLALKVIAEEHVRCVTPVRSPRASEVRAGAAAAAAGGGGGGASSTREGLTASRVILESVPLLQVCSVASQGEIDALRRSLHDAEKRVSALSCARSMRELRGENEELVGALLVETVMAKQLCKLNTKKERNDDDDATDADGCTHRRGSDNDNDNDDNDDDDDDDAMQVERAGEAMRIAAAAKAAQKRAEGQRDEAAAMLAAREGAEMGAAAAGLIRAAAEGNDANADALRAAAAGAASARKAEEALKEAARARLEGAALYARLERAIVTLESAAAQQTTTAAAGTPRVASIAAAGATIKASSACMSSSSSMNGRNNNNGGGTAAVDDKKRNEELARLREENARLREESARVRRENLRAVNEFLEDDLQRSRADADKHRGEASDLRKKLRESERERERMERDRARERADIERERERGERERDRMERESLAERERERLEREARGELDANAAQLRDELRVSREEQAVLLDAYAKLRAAAGDAEAGSTRSHALASRLAESESARAAAEEGMLTMASRITALEAEARSLRRDADDARADAAAATKRISAVKSAAVASPAGQLGTSSTAMENVAPMVHSIVNNGIDTSSASAAQHAFTRREEDLKARIAAADAATIRADSARESAESVCEHLRAELLSRDELIASVTERGAKDARALRDKLTVKERELEKCKAALALARETAPAAAPSPVASSSSQRRNSGTKARPARNGHPYGGDDQDDEDDDDSSQWSGRVGYYKKQRASAGDEDVTDQAYLKNIVIQFLLLNFAVSSGGGGGGGTRTQQSDRLRARASLLPVLATLLRMTPEEYRRLDTAMTKARPRSFLGLV